MLPIQIQWQNYTVNKYNRTKVIYIGKRIVIYNYIPGISTATVLARWHIFSQPGSQRNGSCRSQ